uniref:Arrestin C-terminal-like domain-containing protein n=1 Tax=Plectus sambesii TaxID=2011161 RepID=A0A914UWW1_9BILA
MGRPSKLTKFGSFEVVYKNADKIRLGDVIHGNVELTLSRPLLVQRMTVTFYGEVQYESPQHRVERLQFESQTQELWREPHRSEAGAFLQRGFYVYEFYVGTRMDLPSAFTSSEDCVVRSLVYYCEVRIAESLADDTVIEHIKRKPLQLRAMCSDAPNPRRRGAVLEKDVIYVKNVLDASGCIGATLLLSRRQCKPGHVLFFNVEVLNCFRKLEVYITLVQRAKVCSKVHQQPVFETVTHRLFRIKLGSIKSSEAYKRWIGEQLWIPDTKRIPIDVVNYYGEKIVSLGYSLVLTVRTVVGKSLTLETPLIVRNDIKSASKLSNGTIVSGAATI